jgi:hypothetical protein
VLGDSYAEGFQVDLEQTYWRIAQRKLAENFPLQMKRPEFINFGVSGYGTAQELVALREYGWTFQPDIVLLTITTGNDVRNNSKALEKERMRPFFVLDDGNLVLDTSFRELQGPLRRALLPAVATLSDRSWVVQNVLQVMKNLRASARFEQRSRSPDSAPPSAEIGIDWEVLVPPREPAWEEAWAVTEALIATMANEIANQGAQLVVVVVSNPVQVHPDDSVYRGACRQFAVDNLFYADRRIEAVCTRVGSPCLTLAPLLRERAIGNGTYFHGFNGSLGSGHWNRDGHRVAGEFVAEFLRELVEPHSP